MSSMTPRADLLSHCIAEFAHATMLATAKRIATLSYENPELARQQYRAHLTALPPEAACAFEQAMLAFAADVQPLPGFRQTITVRQYLEDHWARRTDVHKCQMHSQISSGSRVWDVAGIVSGFPLDPGSIYPPIVWFDFTDDFGRRRRGHWPVKPDDPITVWFRVEA